ncbi:MAG: DUF732 domain-containing protein [Mycobacterium sp.]
MNTADHTDDSPTSAGSGATDETTVVPPPAEAAADLAWSLDNVDDTVAVERQSWGLAWGHAAVVLSIAAVVAFVIAIVGWTIMRSARVEQPLPPEAYPTAGTTTVLSTVVAAAPQPSTVIVQAAPTTVTVQAPPPEPKKTVDRAVPEQSSHALVAPRSESVYDQRFLDRIRSLGYTITDPSLAVRNAHEACHLFQLGESAEQVNNQMSARMGADMTDTLQLTSSAILAYPDCFRHSYSDGG